MTDWRVTLTSLELPESDVAAVLATLDSGWLTMGPRTQQLEAAFAEWAGVDHAVAVSSGTAALHLSCVAAGVGPGDEVIVPSLSFVADAHAPACCGATPVLVDSASLAEPGLSAEAVERAITERTKAIVAVHMFGYPAPLDDLRETCDAHGIAVIEDCAEAAGATLPDGRRAGTAGIAGCFSFFSKTVLGVGEGGIVVTGDEEVAQRVRALRSHAMTSVTWDRHRGHAETYDVTDLGFNYRIDEPRATLAHQRLLRLDETVERLREVVREYRSRLGALDALGVPFTDDAVERAGHFAFPVLAESAEARDGIREKLHSRGVQTTFYPAISQLTAYAPAAGRPGCPVAEDFAARHLALPLSPSLDEEKMEIVLSELREAVESP